MKAILFFVIVMTLALPTSLFSQRGRDAHTNKGWDLSTRYIDWSKAGVFPADGDFSQGDQVTCIGFMFSAPITKDSKGSYHNIGYTVTVQQRDSIGNIRLIDIKPRIVGLGASGASKVRAYLTGQEYTKLYNPDTKDTTFAYTKPYAIGVTFDQGAREWRAFPIK